MSQLDFDFGEFDVLEEVRKLIALNDLKVVAHAAGMTDGDLLHAVNRTPRAGGRRKRIISLEVLPNFLRLVGGDDFVRSMARAIGMIAVEGRPPTAVEELLATNRAIEQEFGQETRKGFVRAKRRQLERVIAEKALAEGDE